MDRDREFGEFVDARALVMRRTAFLLCGDWHRAEDIVQNALIKLYVAWPRVRRDSVDAYARKVLVRTSIDESRRGFFQRERSVDAVPERAAPEPSTADLDLRQALDALPPGQRAVVVLRYWEDLSITETARILGRTEGTVKSQAAKGLAALRDLLVDEPQSGIRRSEVIRAGRTKLARRRTAIAGALVFVLVAGLGGVVVALRPQLTASDSAGSAVSGTIDRNAQLTAVLGAADVIPAGVTVRDVPGVPGRALQFFDLDKSRRAVALLDDAQGTGALTIELTRGNATDISTCFEPEVAPCELREVGGIKVRSSTAGRPDGVHLYQVEALRPDGTFVKVVSANVGEFRTNVAGAPKLDAPTSRPAPLPDRETLIKIATLPGLTF
ncbi:SigE family RNA polymerase sigma factor [Lentzea chajnantorensis]